MFKRSVLIIDSHMMVAEFLVTFLEREYKGFTIVKSSSMREARMMLHHHMFDLVLTNVFGHESSGISMINEISEISPKTRCLVLSGEANAFWVDQALRAGAYGFITKTCDSKEILKALDAVMHGRKYLSPDVAQSFAEYFANAKNATLHTALSPREFEIFIQIGQGKTLKLIGLDLNMSAKTVSVHKYNIAKKTGIKSTAKIARYCIEHGLLKEAA
jgi:DNA-binding NarL/FixJ family response regulator